MQEQSRSLGGRQQRPAAGLLQRPPVGPLHRPYDGLATRDGFNRSLRHFRHVGGMVAELERGRNLADILADRLSRKEIAAEQVLPILNALLIDRYHYQAKSHNLRENTGALDALAAEVAGWRAMDLVAAYFHPELGVVPINPKCREHWEGVGGLKKNELLTVYAGPGDGAPEALLRQALDQLLGLVEGQRLKTPAVFRKGRFVPRKLPKAPAPPKPKRPARAVRAGAAAAPAAAAAAAAGPQATLAPAAAPQAPAAGGAPAVALRRMTPQYSIPVTNELFHNGNVEAWKKIMESYSARYPRLEVYVFYEGERIHDINTLFKWGKVKHGSTILIAVAGEDIKDVAKLLRYLKQGASQMFEAFLKAPVNTVLNLF